MNVLQAIRTISFNPSSHDYGIYTYLLPFILVSTVALWLLPGLLAKATSRLVYYIIRRALRGASSSDVVLESGPEGGHVSSSTTTVDGLHKPCRHFTIAACSVHCSGYRLRNFTANAQSLQLRDGPYQLTRLAVEEARLAWPCWQSVQLQARSVRVEVLQRQMPEVRTLRCPCCRIHV
jgi:hypothetical protein